MIDFSAVNVGDRVRLTGSDEVHEFLVSEHTRRRTIMSRQGIEYYESEGWTLEILERAKPELPTEPGWYSSAKDAAVDGVFHLSSDGVWSWVGNKFAVNPERNCSATSIQDRMPLTRLVPAASHD